MGRPNIAIDGPAGAGKSTVARLLAGRLGYLYVDSGAMYRALALKSLRCGIAAEDGPALAALAQTTEVRLERGAEGEPVRVYLDGEDVTAAIRQPEVSRRVSAVAAVPEVRRRMVELQRELAADGGVVMDGRDIGSVVLPDAAWKFYLTASPRERARRRWEELVARGYPADLEQVVREVEERDRADSSRDVGPLVRVPDAVEIDTSKRTPAEVVELMLQVVSSK